MTTAMAIRPLAGREDHDMRPVVNYREKTLTLDITALGTQEAKLLAKQIASTSRRRLIEFSLKVEGSRSLLVCTFSDTIKQLELHAHTVFTTVVKLVQQILGQKP